MILQLFGIKTKSWHFFLEWVQISPSPHPQLGSGLWELRSDKLWTPWDKIESVFIIFIFSYVLLKEYQHWIEYRCELLELQGGGFARHLGARNKCAYPLFQQVDGSQLEPGSTQVSPDLWVCWQEQQNHSPNLKGPIFLI